MQEMEQTKALALMKLTGGRWMMNNKRLTDEELCTIVCKKVVKLQGVEKIRSASVWWLSCSFK